MEKTRKNKSGSGGAMPKKPKPASTVEAAPTAQPPLSVDVERVLEHVTSPFRWELLEIPVVKPTIAIPKASGNHKSRPK